MINLNIKLDDVLEKEIDKILLSITGGDIQKYLIQNTVLYEQYSPNAIGHGIYDCLTAIKCAISHNPCTVTNIDLIRSIFDVYLFLIKEKFSSSNLSQYIYILDRFICNNNKSSDGLVLQTGYIVYNNPHHGKYR